MTDSQGLQTFGPYSGLMAQAWKSAMSDVWTAFHHPEHNSRCKTTLLQNHAVIHLKRLLLGECGFIHGTHDSQDIFMLPGTAVVVAKKLNKNLLPTYHVSRRGAEFYSQEDIPGLEAWPRLICGAVLSDDNSSILGVYITHPQRRGNSYNWALDITDGCNLVDEFQSRMDFSPENTHIERTNPFKPRYGKRETGPDTMEGTGTNESTPL